MTDTINWTLFLVGAFTGLYGGFCVGYIAGRLMRRFDAWADQKIDRLKCRKVEGATHG